MSFDLLLMIQGLIMNTGSQNIGARRAFMDNAVHLLALEMR